MSCLVVHAIELQKKRGRLCGGVDFVHSVVVIFLILIIILRSCLADFFTSLHHRHSSVEATEAKMLRVSLSSFYDLLRVVLRCYQEFQ